ncbi:MAG: UDP-N-acetylglucosamine 2-epimerase (non-hydrolyzing) [Pyrinomonadaceae bacterium]|nr:UDP-N-acetylglucosamine 2-epimerase (non-hydrolyzing) [Pyrinomonadaceae bacterium]
MKVMTIFGTRPEIIRLSLIVKLLDQNCEHIMVHTGQNYHASLSDNILRQLQVRQPDFHLGIHATNFAKQVGEILYKADEIIERVKPDRILILGDTNSALTAIVAARRGIPVFHMEAGNRCYDDRVPEEVNRRIIDHASTVLMPYTERSKENLIREGIERERIFVIGNPINEVLKVFAEEIDNSAILKNLSLKPYEYFLVTLHRAENVDDRSRLSKIFEGLKKISESFGRKVLLSVHPRTADKIEKFKLDTDGFFLMTPPGFFDFVKLEKNAYAVLTDSGTVQEECAILKIPNVTIRDVTERPETIESGSNILSGAEPESILKATKIVLSQINEWNPPREYLIENVSQIVSKIVLGYVSIRKHV